MPTPVNVRALEFVRATPPRSRGRVPDRLDSGRLVLDPGGPTYRATLLWRPVAETWVFSLWLTSGAAIVQGVAVRDRTDLLLGCSVQGRPAGGVFSYDPKGRGDPGLLAYAREGVLLVYAPTGIPPEALSLYGGATAVP